jgi:murein DD-endopeptidase MepM/ murein hydrolase activator NlpD
MLLLNFIFLIAIIMIFWKVSGAFTPQNYAEGIGTRQAAILHTYGLSEQMLLYTDVAARYAAYEAILSTFEQEIITGCGTYAEYPLWSSGETLCIPQRGTTQVYDAFFTTFNAALARRLVYPGFPQISYDFSIDTTQGIVVRGIAKDNVRLPITAAKDTTQSSITGILQRENLIANQKGTFSSDSGLATKVSPSPNTKTRLETSFIIITGSGTPDASIAALQYLQSGKSTHYLIDKDGSITQFVPERLAAKSMTCNSVTPCALGGMNDPDVASIVITLVNEGPLDKAVDTRSCKDGVGTKTKWCGIGDFYKGLRVSCTGDRYNPRCWDPYTKEQLAALSDLTADIAHRNAIPTTNIRLEEQILWASDAPGPLLTLGKAQNLWWQEFILDIAVRIAKLKSSAPIDEEDVQPVVTTTEKIADTQVGLAWPTQSTVITSCFGERELLGRSFHGGLDIAASEGKDDIKAIADGLVVDVTTGCPNACGTTCPSGCSSGNNVLIKHSENFYSRYSHLSSASVKKGDVVKRSEVLGKAGNTGSSTGAHLDIKIYRSDPKNNKPVNPLCVFPNELLQQTTFASSAATCKRYGLSKITHENPVLAKECTGIEPFVAVPSCVLNQEVADMGGSVEITTTLDNINKVPGLMDALKKYSDAEGVPIALVLAIIAQESRGRSDLISPTGCAGLGQFCLSTAQDSNFATIFGAGLQSCSCTKSPCTATQAQCASDPRMDPFKSAQAIPRLLRIKRDFAKFKNTKDQDLFAIAAYNGGEGVIQKAFDRTGLSDPSWEQVSTRLQSSDITYFRDESSRVKKVNEIRSYVKKVSSNYASLGGKVGAMRDQLCDTATVKELGTYLFAPSFTVELPNVFTQVPRAAEFAQTVLATCDGSNHKDNEQCLVDEMEKFQLRAPDLNISSCQDSFSGFKEAIADCKENLQYGCTCAWQPPVRNSAKNVTIDMHGDVPHFIIDGVSENSYEDDAVNTAKFKRNYDAPIETRSVRYTFLYENGVLQQKFIELNGESPYPLQEENITFFNGDDITWMLYGAGSWMCGEYKTKYPVCVGVKEPIYDLSVGERVDPTIRFALDLPDMVAPLGIKSLLVTQPELVGQPEQVLDRVEFSFMPSTSKDVSYYVVRCAKSIDTFSDEFDDIAYGRAAGVPISASITMTLKSCNGKPVEGGKCSVLGVPNPAGCYKISVTPIDLSGNEGDTTIYDQAKAVLPIGAVAVIPARSVVAAPPVRKPTVPLIADDTLIIGDSISVGYLQYFRCNVDSIAQQSKGTSWMNTQLAARLATRKYRTIVVLGGVNDIASLRSSSEIIANLKSMQSSANGAKVRFATILPWKNYRADNYVSDAQPGSSWTAAKQKTTDEVNAWIRTQPDFIDTNIYMEDSVEKQTLKKEFRGTGYDGYLHPTKGYDDLAAFMQGQLGCSASVVS